MVRLALLGALSSHTEKFCKCASDRNDVEIVGIFGEDNDRVSYLANTYHLDICSPEELLERCDIAAICFRDGNKHLRYAKPFLQKGIPLFVDKPITTQVEDAEKLFRLSEEYGCPIIGGSCVKLSEEILMLKQKIQKEDHLLSGFCSFTIDFDSPYGGIHFYSHHLIETMLQLFGTGIRSITAKKTGNVLTAIAAYNDFQVTMQYGVQYGQYFAGYFGNDSCDIIPYQWTSAVEAQFQELVTFAKTREATFSPEFYLTAVKVSCALERSLQESRTVPV